MAVFSSGTLDRLNTIEDKKVQSYLYKLNEDLTYMFNNLTPEDNYSKSALQVLSQANDTVAELSVSVDGIFANYLKGDSLIASIALDDSGVQIQGSKINLVGTVTANNYFKINTDGSMEAKNGKFSGTLNVAKGMLYADNESVCLGGFYAYESERSGAQYLALQDQTVGMGSGGSYAFWAGGSGDNPPFRVSRNTGIIHAPDIYIDVAYISGYSVAEILEDLDERVADLEVRK